MQKVLRLKSEFERIVHRADEILVASAMLTSDGVGYFDNRKKDCIFSVLVGIDLPTQPKALQKLLDDSIDAKVHNIKGQFFHPKVYLFRNGEHWTGFVGSGNCTRGGIESNLEMTLKTEDEHVTADLVKWFNLYYQKHGTNLTQEFIDDYEVLFSARKYLEEELRAKVSSFKNETGVSKGRRKLSDYVFTNQFFQFEHYNAFTGRKPILDTPETRQERFKVQEKLLELHKKLYPEIQKRGWDVYEHHMPQHITSSYRHNERASKELDALWLHYGRGEEELAAYQNAYGDNMTSLFHMRLEVLVFKSHLWIELRVGKRDGSYPDRGYIKEQLKSNKVFTSEYLMLLQELDKPFTLTIANQEVPVHDFEDKEALKQFTLQDNPSKYYFRIGREYQPDDKAISNQQIVSTIMKDFEKLYPIYQLFKHSL
ncbi:phospholipase D family protein [Spongiivirga sp. MCCC 1A20706]|uniref:phospholipase D family protein n=1 Tax=Spongiivirga sp. MCCC 1A20706 TaxID=3160963 RepID=UPI003977A8CC